MIITVGLFIFLVLALGTLFGVLRARKKSLSTAISRLILTLIALPVALLAAIGISRPAAGAMTSALASSIPELGSAVADAPEIGDVIRVFCAAILALILFLMLYPAVTALLRIAVKPLSRLLERWFPVLNRTTGDESAEKSGNSAVRTAIRMGIGGVCGLILSVILLSPLTGLLGMVGDALSLPAAIGRRSDPAAAETLTELSDSFRSLPVRIVGWMGGKPICRALTGSKAAGIRIDPAREFALMGDLGDYLSDPAENKPRFSTYSDASEKSAILREILPEMAERMFDRWAEGGKFMGITVPNASDASGEILHSGLDGLAGLDRDKLRDSMTAMLDVTAYLLDGGDLSKLDGLLTDEEQMTEVYVCLIESEPLHGLLRSTLEAGMQSMTRKWGGAGLTLEGDFPSDSEGIRKEAESLAHATMLLMHYQDSFSLDADNLTASMNHLGEILDDFKQTELIGKEQVQELVESALRSEDIQKALNFDSQQAEKAIEDIRRESENRDFSEMLSELAEQGFIGKD